MYYDKPYVIVTGLDPKEFKQTTLVFGSVNVIEGEDEGCFEITGYNPIRVDDFDEAQNMVEKFLLAEDRKEI